MALKDYPEWVLIHKGHNREIRFINGKYYLYQVHSKRVDGKVKKTTDKYLGRITEEGLISPTKKLILYKVKEYYSTIFVFNVCSSVIEGIMKRYPSKSKQFLPNAFLTLLFDNDLVKWNKSYLSILYPNFKLSNKTNDEIERIISMMKYHIDKFLNGKTIKEFFEQISDIYMVGVKDEYTLATISDDTQETLNKYNLNKEINYGKESK